MRRLKGMAMVSAVVLLLVTAPTKFGAVELVMSLLAQRALGNPIELSPTIAGRFNFGRSLKFERRQPPGVQVAGLSNDELAGSVAVGSDFVERSSAQDLGPIGGFEKSSDGLPTIWRLPGEEVTHPMLTGDSGNSSMKYERQNSGWSDSDSGFAIITTDSIVANSLRLANFVDVKTLLGFTVTIVTDNDYGNLQGDPPNGTSEKIRKWLQNNYLSLHLRYVLLIGDPSPDDPRLSNEHVGDVPMKMLFPRLGDGYWLNDNETPSDLYYSNLTGNWNLDGDDFYGEYRSASTPVIPDPRINQNTFSVRWTGKINIADSNGLRIAPFYDDGIRIWVDDLAGTPVIDSWSDHADGFSIYDFLTPGLHDIRIEYYQNTSNAFIRIWAGSVGSSWFYRTLQADELYFWDGDSLKQGGLVAEFFDDTSFSELMYSTVSPNAVTPYFQYDWYAGDLGQNGLNFTPQVSVGRIPVYNCNYASLDSILDKAIAYQNATNLSWRNRALLAMNPFWDGTTTYRLGEKIRTEYCDSRGYRPFRIYDSDHGLTPPPEMTPCSISNVMTAWNNPLGLALMMNLTLSQSYVEVLDNDFPSLVVHGSHYGGEPEYYDNFSSRLLRNGGIGCVASTRNYWFDVSGDPFISPSNLLLQSFCHYLCANLILGQSFGDALCGVKNVAPENLGNFGVYNAFAYNLSGDPSLSFAPSSFVDDVPPAAPQLLLPISGSTVPSGQVDLVWHRSMDSLSWVNLYILDYADNSQFLNLTSEEIADTSYRPNIQTWSPTFFWRVKSIDIYGNESEWSEVGSFVLSDVPLSPPVLRDLPNSPAVDGRIRLSWSRLETSDGYELEWSTNGQFSPEMGSYTSTSSSDTSHSVSCLAQGTWYFRVRATKAGQTPSDWSNVVSGMVDYTQSMPFSANPNGWSYSNEANNVWPSAWYNRFNYYGSGSLYTTASQNWFENNSVEEYYFPDWPLYARTMIGLTGCCYNNSVYQPKMDGLTQWLHFVANRGYDWDGSCTGFAVTSLFFFDHVNQYEVGQEYPGYSALYSVPSYGSNPADPNFYEINKYWLNHFKSGQMSYFQHQNATTTPARTLELLAAMFNNTSRQEDRYLIMDDHLGSGFSHAVIPISLEYQGCGTNLATILVYDNSANPPTEQRFVTVNLNSNTWNYTSVDGQHAGGSLGLYLSEPIGVYDDFHDYKKLPQDSGLFPIKVFVSYGDDVLLSLNGGSSMGYVSGEVILPTDSSAGVPIVPISEHRSWPICYDLADQSFDATITSISGTGYVFSAFRDSTMLSVSRGGMQIGQSDIVKCDHIERRILITNTASQAGNYKLEAISGNDSVDVDISFRNFLLDSGDSCKLAVTGSTNFRLVNYGDSTSYDLKIGTLSHDSGTSVNHFSIPCLGGSAQEIYVETLASGNVVATLYADNDNNGIADDTLLIANQPNAACGDINLSGRIDITDAVYLINYIFAGGPAPQPNQQSGDINCSSRVDITDVVYLINYIFANGPRPCAACP